MLHAVLNGKVTNREIGEDVLTSTVFGILKHLPVQEVWLPILERAQDRHSKRECSLAQCIRERAGVRAEDYVRAHVTFWPQLADFGEPDLVVTFTGADSSSSPPPLACVIEVKLWSPKSGGKDDQLHKYFRALHSPQLACATEGRRAMPLGLVYLTALEASADVDESRGNWPDGDSRLFQCFELAWQDVTDVLCDCAHKLIGKGQLAAMTEDLTAFLKKMTLSRFTGFEELSIENFSDSWGYSRHFSENEFLEFTMGTFDFEEGCWRYKPHCGGNEFWGFTSQPVDCSGYDWRYTRHEEGPEC